MIGHVDHGKTSITHQLTDKWTDTHSEELKRGITIKVGYADATFYKCPRCERYVTKEKCPCGGKGKLLRKISFLDAPGHEMLMTTAIAASSIIDGAVLVIAANEKCPQPQTAEHLMILDILGIEKIVIIQNKIDLVSKEKADEHHRQIKEFVKGTKAENAPIVPIAAHYGINFGELVKAIELTIPTPERNPDADPRMYVTRSFDVNKPGCEIKNLNGGSLGGTLVQGVLKKGDKIEMKPGISRKVKEKEVIEPVQLTVEDLYVGSEKVDEVGPGGLIAIATKLDPAVTKGDGLVGNQVGKKGTLPEVSYEVTVDYKILERADIENPLPKKGEPLLLSVGTARSLGVIAELKSNKAKVKLKRPVCVDKGSPVAISRRMDKRWRLSGFGVFV